MNKEKVLTVSNKKESKWRKDLDIEKSKDAATKRDGKWRKELETEEAKENDEKSIGKENGGGVKGKPPKSLEEVRGRPSSCVFVASLCSGLLDDELCVSVTKHFEQWGKLCTVKVLRDTSNRPYAFVQYGNDEDCTRAIKHGHNSVLNGRNLRCERAKVNRTLYVCSPTGFNSEEIMAFMEKYGEVEQVAASNFTGALCESKSTRFWYVKFVYRDDAIRAFANLTEGELYRVEWAQNIETEDEPESVVRFDKFSIFVGQLAQEIHESDLRERFSRHGTIDHLDLIRKPTNVFAFIRFHEEAGAASAVERENHSMLCGKTMHVQYREIHVSSKVERVRGIALAPPPINLKKQGKRWGQEFRRPPPPAPRFPRRMRSHYEGKQEENTAPNSPSDKSGEQGAHAEDSSPSSSRSDVVDPKDTRFEGAPYTPYFYYFPGPGPDGRIPPPPSAQNYYYPPFFFPYEEMRYQYPVYYPE